MRGSAAQAVADEILRIDSQYLINGNGEGLTYILFWELGRVEVIAETLYCPAMQFGNKIYF